MPVSVEIAVDNSNGNMQTSDLLQLAPSQPEDTKSQSPAPLEPVTNNGNITADLLGLSQQHETKDKQEEQTTKMDNTPILEANNGNPNVGHISANFIQTERMAEVNNKLDDFTTHNGHNHPLTLQNAI
uniref:Uncharacterized protein n=1 Tax=Pararge aegeria TaxID=116150 RepID=S4P8A2_9NEOP